MAVGMRPNQSPALDDAALEAASLYEHHAARIEAYCLHVLRDRTEAEDAVQTTFLNAHRALRRGVRPEHEYAWLHTIAKNACRTLQRTKGRRAPVASDVDVDSIPGHENDAEELRALLTGALAELPDSQRRAVVLREWHGLTPVEIAERLGLSVPATYALLTRARRSLATALTTTLRGQLSALNLGALAELLRAAKGLLGSTASKAAVVAAVATVSVGVGGVAVDRSPSVRQRAAKPPVDAVTAPAPAVERATDQAAAAPRPRRVVTPRPRGSMPANRARAAPSSPRAAPVPSEPASAPQATPLPRPETPQQPTAPEGSHVSPPAPTAGEPPVPPLPPLPGVPPLLPDLASGDLVPPIEVPPVPVVPELTVEVEVQPPQLPLP